MSLVKVVSRSLPIACLLILLLCTVPSFGKTPPKVTNVHFNEYQPGKVAIYYNLDGEKDKTYKVSVTFSPDGGLTYSIKPVSIFGDVGKGIQPGQNLKITWDMEKNYPYGVPPGKYICRVTAKEPDKVWPWLAGGGVLVAGGVAILLLQPEEEGPTTGTLVIEVPDHP